MHTIILQYIDSLLDYYVPPLIRKNYSLSLDLERFPYQAEIELLLQGGKTEAGVAWGKAREISNGGEPK